MNGLKNAAIILLGMGETCAADVLKNMSHKEVESIIEAMNTLGDVSEQDVIEALHDFFRETKMTAGIHVTSSQYFRNTLVSAVGSDKADSMLDETFLTEDYKGLELLRWQLPYAVLDALEDEHPQVITVALMSVDSEFAARILDGLPTETMKNVIKRMTNVSPVSQYAIAALSDYLQDTFTRSEKYKIITSDSVNVAANVIRYLNDESEKDVMSYLSEDNTALSEKIQGKLFPFERLMRLDPRGLQVVLSEASNEDLVLALKGLDPASQAVFFKQLSAKTVDLLKDDMDSLGPVKASAMVDAQKRLVELAKKLIEEQRIASPP